MQFSLKFEHKPNYSAQDFFVTESNKAAYEAICQNEWDFFCHILIGEEGSGKTHLSKVWAEGRDAVELSLSEDFADKVTNHHNFVIRIDEMLSATEQQNFFHIYNMIRERMCHLLVISTLEIDEFAELPDLKSRLKIAPKSYLQQADDELLQMMLFKSFSDRQMKVASEVINYLQKRVERNGKAVKQLAEYIENNSKGRNITLPYIRKLLKDKTE